MGKNNNGVFELCRDGDEEEAWWRGGTGKGLTVVFVDADSGPRQPGTQHQRGVV